MPIYEYQCTSCHHAFDVIQKMSDKPTTLCPECSKNTAIKLVSAAGFQLKGTGWYETDFKNKGQSEKGASKKSTSTTTKADSSASDKKVVEPSSSSTSKGE